MLRVAIVGASGYTGAELLRLLVVHPRVTITRVVGHGKAGEPIARVLPNFAGVLDGEIRAYDADDIKANADAAFCALPHGASAAIVAQLRERGIVVFDLSADFRLSDPAIYKTWYGEHGAPALFGKAIYGLPELHREALKTADLVAVPGCYPTASTLALAPLLKKKLIATSGIIVDAKSGTTGAGRTPGASTNFSEMAEGLRAYKAGGLHRHTPEIEQELSLIAGKPIRLTFTPHLVPMTRGILATTYALASSDSTTAEECTEVAREFYKGSPSVTVLGAGSHPDTTWVRGSNRAQLAYARDARTGMIIGQSVIDNLCKGAAGQAVQCMNVRFAFEENEALRGVGMFP
ncbi:MAG: N-acetyl-gamma-glutamyl-phosphate reductase [Sandaracinaceae bacterium]|jgi:N-acetyl-gamma-glutamyl-phosphate reductase|nr:N-acetyl-gamma-glutamyl-phosphate reductase [Sandaracinaceae bacterium]